MNLLKVIIEYMQRVRNHPRQGDVGTIVRVLPSAANVRMRAAGTTKSALSSGDRTIRHAREPNLFENLSLRSAFLRHRPERRPEVLPRLVHCERVQRQFNMRSKVLKRQNTIFCVSGLV